MDAILIGTLALVLAAAVGSLVLRRSVRSRTAVPGPRGGSEGPPVVVLDLDGADPADPAVIRLVREAGVRLLAASPDVDEVEVRDRGGRVLGRADRRIARPSPIAIPAHLYEPHANGSRGPSPLRAVAEEERPSVHAPRPQPVEARIARPLAERFELPDGVWDRVADPDDPVDLVRAILEEGGWDVAVAGDLLRVGDVAVVVVPAHGVELVGSEALNHAFRRVQEARAHRGVVLSIGPLHTADVRRREMLAPHVLHAGPDGIQRMADAVAVGADPLRFAVAPALAT